MKGTLLFLWVLAAALAETLAWLHGSAGGSPWAYALAIAAHGFAALCSVAAANTRPTCRVERDLVGILAFGLPVLGPLTAWAILGRHDEQPTEDAHAAFEATRTQVEHPARERLTGNWILDLENQVYVESYREVLRFGDLSRRSGLVRKLSQLGRPEHMALLRDCLEDRDEELRIQAFAQLRGWREVHEARIHEAQKAVAAGVPQARIAYAQANQDFASSGVLDPELEPDQWERALTSAREAQAEDPTLGIQLEIHALAHLGRIREARVVYARASRAIPLTVPLIEAWARVQFDARNWKGLRLASKQLQRMNQKVPAWIQMGLASTRPLWQEVSVEE